MTNETDSEAACDSDFSREAQHSHWRYEYERDATPSDYREELASLRALLWADSLADEKCRLPLSSITSFLYQIKHLERLIHDDAQALARMENAL